MGKTWLKNRNIWPTARNGKKMAQRGPKSIQKANSFPFSGFGLRVCRPAREPKTGKPQKVLPRVLSGALSEIRVLSRVCSRECSQGCSPCCSPQQEPLESTLGSTLESTPISESTPKSTLESTFGGFPVFVLSRRSTDSQISARFPFYARRPHPQD